MNFMNGRKIAASVMVMIMTAVSGFAGGKPEEKAAKPYEISWYFIGNGPQAEVQLVEEAANQYLKGKLNATIKLYCFDWGSYTDKMQVMIASGEHFDICFTSSWANNYRQNVARGAFLDIMDLLDKYAPKTKAQLHPAFLSGSAIDGRNYAIPANKELAHQWGFMLRKDLVDRYGFDISRIKKFADIEPMLKVIKEKESGMIALQNVVNETGFKALDFDRIGDDKIPGVIYNDSRDMKVFNELEAPETMEYFKMVHRFYQAGYIPKDAATATNFGEDRRAGKVFASVNSLKPLGDEETSKGYGLPLIQVALTQPVVQTRDCTGAMQAISRTSENPELALRFLELFNTDKYLNNLINFGIEGKHFVKVEENEIDLPAGVTPQNSGYRPNTPWMFGNQYINYFWKGSNQAKWNLFKEFNDSAYVAKSVGFNFDAEPVKTEIAACINVWNEFLPGLTTGTVDPEKALPQAIAKFKAVGVDKVIAEKQRQLDEWLKRVAKK